MVWFKPSEASEQVRIQALCACTTVWYHGIADRKMTCLRWSRIDGRFMKWFLAGAGC
jgi:hypothetical protein